MCCYLNMMYCASFGGSFTDGRYSIPSQSIPEPKVSRGYSRPISLDDLSADSQSIWKPPKIRATISFDYSSIRRVYCASMAAQGGSIETLMLSCCSACTSCWIALSNVSHFTSFYWSSSSATKRRARDGTVSIDETISLLKYAHHRYSDVCKKYVRDYLAIESITHPGTEAAKGLAAV